MGFAVPGLDQAGVDRRGETRIANQPEWSLLDLPHLEHLPGIRWKLHNLERLQKANARKFAEQSDALARLLG